MKTLNRHLACAAFAVLGLIAVPAAMAQAVPSATSQAVAAKLSLRGEAPDVSVPEIRIARRGGFLSVQADLRNAGKEDQAVFYRFRWLDQAGNQHGSGDAWKQLNLLSDTQQTIKGTGPHASVSDFRLELSFESK
jgi:uncharacterized protein YcfL